MGAGGHAVRPALLAVALLAAWRGGDSRAANAALEACPADPRAPVAACRLYRERNEHGMMAAQNQTA